MINVNTEIFNQVVEQAKHDAGGEARWINAIDRAVKMLDGNPYVEVQADGLLVMSDTSFNIYLANDTCQCAAYIANTPCKHRSLNRLIRRYNEIITAREAEADADGQIEHAVQFDGVLEHYCEPTAAPAPRRTMSRMIRPDEVEMLRDDEPLLIDVSRYDKVERVGGIAI